LPCLRGKTGMTSCYDARVYRHWYIALIIPILFAVSCTKNEEQLASYTFAGFPEDLITEVDVGAGDLAGEPINHIGPIASSAGLTYVFNSESAELLQLDQALMPVRKVGRFGQRKGEYSQAVTQIMMGTAHVIVFDAQNRKALFFSHDGRLMTEIHFPASVQSRPSILWSEEESRLFYLDRKSVTEGVLFLTAVAPNPGLFRRRKVHYTLDASNPSPFDVDFTDLVGATDGEIYLVDNYVDASPAKQISLHVFSLHDGSVVTSMALIDHSGLVDLSARYETTLQRGKERSERLVGLVIRPIAHVWVVNSRLVLVFRRTTTSAGLEAVSAVALDPQSGDTRLLADSLWEGTQVIRIYGASDTTLTVAYRQSGQIRLLSARLLFPGN
jgi:hypothetical protein